MKGKIEIAVRRSLRVLKLDLKHDAGTSPSVACIEKEERYRGHLLDKANCILEEVKRVRHRGCTMKFISRL